MNQCDGCRLNLPLRNGIHYWPETGYGHMACTADLYRADSAPSRVEDLNITEFLRGPKEK